MLPAAFFIALAAAAPRDGLPPGAGEPRTGRCHMGECSWFSELRRETVRETGDGRLLRLELVGGISASGEGEDYAESWGPNARVEWDDEPHEVWIFCAPRLPTVMIRTDDGIQADVLDFVNGSPPVHESARRLFVHACHGEETEDFAERYGYLAPVVEELALARPEDVFDHLR